MKDVKITTKHIARSLLFISQLCVILLFGNTSVASDLFTFEIDSIRETRSDNDFFARTEVSLNIFGDNLENYRGILPVEVTKAYTDNNFILKEKNYHTAENIFSFVKIQSNNKSSQQIVLTTPKRDDRKLFIQGEVSLYKPQESSLIELKDYNKLSLKRVSNPILEKNGIDVLFFTKYEFQDFITNSEKIINNSKLKNINVHDALVEQFGSELTYVAENYQRFFQGDYWDIYFVISGNWQKVVNVEFFNKAGRRINNPSRSIGHGPNNIIVLLDFDNKLPSNGNVKLEIIQDGDITIHPFKVVGDLK
ncbi:MAG: hypothetical protein JRE64_22130 [Deltaproteobacteria bacterium]|nr:hypothetical protein [Deltaproteobacteria bacterium]